MREEPRAKQHRAREHREHGCPCAQPVAAEHRPTAGGRPQERARASARRQEKRTPIATHARVSGRSGREQGAVETSVSASQARGAEPTTRPDPEPDREQRQRVELRQKFQKPIWNGRARTGTRRARPTTRLSRVAGATGTSSGKSTV